MRKGMMKGRGKGYKNVVGKDPMVHSQSAKGMKQPQKMPFQPSPMKDQELAKVIRGLDPIQHNFFITQLAITNNPEKAMEVVVNMVEGDTSQLSPDLLKYATKKGWLKGYGETQSFQKYEDLKDEYRTLLNQDLEDYKIGIENIGIKRRMAELEKYFKESEEGKKRKKSLKERMELNYPHGFPYR